MGGGKRAPFQRDISVPQKHCGVKGGGNICPKRTIKFEDAFVTRSRCCITECEYRFEFTS